MDTVNINRNPRTIHEAKRVWTFHRNTGHEGCPLAQCPKFYSSFETYLDSLGISGLDSNDQNSGQENLVDEFLAGLSKQEAGHAALALQTPRGRNNRAGVDPSALEIMRRCEGHIEALVIEQKNMVQVMDRLGEIMTALVDLLDRRVTRG